MISIDIATLISVIAGTFTMIAVIISLFLWLRSEANSDRRNMQEIQREDRKDLLQMGKNIESMVLAIESEIKDFHYRLLEIEKSRK